MSRDNYNPYRIVGAKKIDVWFYEEGDMRRTHRIVYELIVLPLYGVCENSFLDYRHHSDELLELFIQPPYIEVPLWLMVMTVKKMPVHEANRFFELLRTKMDRIFRKRSYPLTAEQLLRLLVDALAEFIYSKSDATHCRRGGRYRSPLFLYDVMQLCVQSPSVCISATGSIIPSS